MKKKGAMELSFGMLFSIILIIIFIAFAIYGVSKFLNLQKGIQTKTFANDLNYDIDKLWKSQGSQPVSYTLPKNVEKVCFSEDENKLNINIMGKNFIETYDIEHATLSKDFSKDDCVSVENGKIALQLEKTRGEALVVIEK